ncbi:MAG: hypothetical protein NXI00_13130 [Cytophagales bacterium]|nr:hypothetical protein [Cytophagales bacterium]
MGNNYTDTTIFDAPRYQFFITDHLGNTRLIVERIDDSTAVVQETHYGVWGEVLTGIGVAGDWDFLFQGKEYVDAFGYNGYDFHARQYDPWEGRFTSIDPVDFYSISGYAGMLNNPLSYTDKNGDCPVCVAVGIGALIGGAFNGVKYASQDKGFFNGFWRGAITGAAGGLAGYFAPIGILPGLGYVAATGAGTGALGAGLNGENIGRGAIYGGIGGGIFGSVSGGIQASRLGANVWTGYRAPHELPISALESMSSTGGSQDYLDKLVELNYSDISDVDMIVSSHVPHGYGLKDGAFLDLKDGSLAAGVTQFPIWKHGGSRVYIAPTAFSSKEKLAFTLAHELGHVSLNSTAELRNLAAVKNSSSNRFIDTKGHVAIQDMTLNLIRKNNWNIGYFGNQVPPMVLDFQVYDSRLLKALQPLIRTITFPK